MTKSNKNINFFTVNEIEGSLLICESVVGIAFGEVVQILTRDGEEKTGQVIDVSDKFTIIQIFEKTSGLSVRSTGIRFTGDTIKLAVSTDMLGRIFSGVGKPIEGFP